MRSIKRAARLSLVASAVALCVAGGASAAQFSQTYFFGDSLTDSGVYGSRFTTNPGTVWSEDLAAYFGTAAKPITQGGTNYAMGGARVTRQDTYNPQAHAVADQVSGYLAGNSIDANALYFIGGGANDIFYHVGLAGAGLETSAQVQAGVGGAAADLLGQIARLHAAGARFIMVANVPDIGKTPLQTATPTAPFGALSTLYNTTLSQGLDRLGFDVISLDLYNLVREVVANPAAFGFVNATVPACTTSSSLTCTPATLRDPNAPTTWVFADAVHPTTGMHRVASDYAVSIIEAPEKIALLAEVPLQASAAQTRSVTNRMMSSVGGQRAAGSFEMYGTYDYSPSDIDRGPRTGGADNKANSVTIGGDKKIGENLIAGVALGFSNNKSDFNDNAGNFKLEEAMLTAYGVYSMGAAYGGAALTLGNLDYKNVTRSFALGAGTRSESGKTHGSQGGLGLYGGYWLTAGQMTHGPFGSLTYQKVSVAGYAEDGADSTTMHFADQDRESFVGALGWQISASLGTGGMNLSPFARLSYEHEFKDSERAVRANLVTMGGSFAMPVYRPDANNGRLEFGISAQLGKTLTGFAGYSATVGQSGARSQGLNLGIKLPI